MTSGDDHGDTTQAGPSEGPEGWREGLSFEELNKIAPELQQWLDGIEGSTLGLITGESDRVKIWARLLEELDPERTGEFIALGLDAEEDMLAMPGIIDRDQLLAIVRHPEIIALNPVRRSRPAGPATPTGPV